MAVLKWLHPQQRTVIFQIGLPFLWKCICIMHGRHNFSLVFLTAFFKEMCLTLKAIVSAALWSPYQRIFIGRREEMCLSTDSDWCVLLLQPCQKLLSWVSLAVTLVEEQHSAVEWEKESDVTGLLWKTCCSCINSPVSLIWDNMSVEFLEEQSNVVGTKCPCTCQLTW